MLPVAAVRVRLLEAEDLAEPGGAAQVRKDGACRGIEEDVPRERRRAAACILFGGVCDEKDMSGTRAVGRCHNWARRGGGGRLQKGSPYDTSQDGYCNIIGSSGWPSRQPASPSCFVCRPSPASSPFARVVHGRPRASAASTSFGRILVINICGRRLLLRCGEGGLQRTRSGVGRRGKVENRLSERVWVENRESHAAAVGL